MHHKDQEMAPKMKYCTTTTFITFPVNKQITPNVYKLTAHLKDKYLPPPQKNKIKENVNKLPTLNTSKFYFFFQNQKKKRRV